MRITYERVYYDSREESTPPDAVRAEAEKNIQFLLQSREHVFYTTKLAERYTPMIRGGMRGPDGWIVTFTPEAES